MWITMVGEAPGERGQVRNKSPGPTLRIANQMSACGWFTGPDSARLLRHRWEMNELLVGYARESTEQQDLTAQRDGLHALGWVMVGSMLITV